MRIDLLVGIFLGNRGRVLAELVLDLDFFLFGFYFDKLLDSFLELFEGYCF